MTQLSFSLSLESLQQHVPAFGSTAGETGLSVGLRRISRCVVHGAARVLHAAAMRWSRLLWLRLWLAALLVWVRCRADGEEEQRHQAARLAAGTGDGGGHSSTPLSQCTYTFILPEMMTTGATQLPSWPGRGEPTLGGNSLLGEAAEGTHSPVVGQRVQHLELAIENYTHWIQQIEGFVRTNINVEARRLEQSTVNDDTAAILDMSTNLLYQTAKHTRKLMDVETQVLDQTSRLEIQLLENSLSNNKLETQLLQQSSEITKLAQQNGVLEQRLHGMELQHQQQLEALLQERSGLQEVVLQQNQLIAELESRMALVSSDNSLLENQQQQLRETIRRLQDICSKDTAVEASNSLEQADERRMFRDCADVLHAGFNESGVYTIRLTSQQTAKVYCDMETAGGGWTVLQRRQDGTTDFHRTWEEYKMGFGPLSGEHWLGNELVFLLSSQRQYSLRVELTDWDEQHGLSQYEHFHISSEKQKYRLSVKGYSGTAGRLSSLVSHGADFSTKDVDNDKCICHCAPLLTGGWWFDACGASNLNGVYYSKGHNTGKINGIKWHYFKGPSYSLQKTTMMIRPLDFGDSLRGLKTGRDAALHLDKELTG